MNKKFKYTSLVAAGAVTLGLVGGTLAWFTSSDSVTNKFSTGDYNNTNGAGIEIVENWNPEAAKGITPGSNVNKDVQVQNTTTYDQFIRVKLTPQFVKVTGEGENETRTPYTENGITNEVIELNFTSHLKQISEGLEDGTWVKSGEYYYYLAKVSGGNHTNTLLDSVTLSSDAGNKYHGLDFDVVVEADSIQASNGAYEGWASTELHEKYAQLEAGEADTGLVDDLRATDHNHDHDEESGN